MLNGCACPGRRDVDHLLVVRRGCCGRNEEAVGQSWAQLAVGGSRSLPLAHTVDTWGANKDGGLCVTYGCLTIGFWRRGLIDPRFFSIEEYFCANSSITLRHTCDWRESCLAMASGGTP